MLALVTCLTTTAEAQTARPAAVQKDPAVATIFSVLVTGLGQVYAGKPGKGALLFGGAVASGLVGLNMIQSSNNAIDANGSTSQSSVGYALVGASVGLWIYSFASAHVDADEYNQAHRVVLAPFASPGRGGFAVSVASW